MKKRVLKPKCFWLIIMMGLSLTVFAQQREIKGNVTDAHDDGPLPGVNVRVKGSTLGTITDLDGNFTIKAANDNVLVLSYIGYTSQEVIVGSQNSLTIKLEASDVGLDEVVVIGYGQVKKEDATGAISTVSTKDFNQGAITSPQDLISGKTSGVQITSAGGAPGSNATIRIRGGSSLSASNDPLFIIDGVAIDNDGVSGMANPLNIINPNDIESFTVLKDASATAIYGSRASNGVIIITTKKGKNGGLKISYNGNASVGFRTKQIESFSGDEFRQLVEQREGVNSNAVSLLGNANTNWQDEIFQPSIGHDHNLSVSGTVKALPYRVSLGHTNQEGLLKTSELQRTTGSINLSPSLFDNHLKIDLNLKGMYIKNRFAQTGAIASAILYDPTQPVYSGNEAFGGYTTWLDGGIPNTLSPDNPVAMLEQRNDRADVKRTIGNLKLDYNFHFLPDLTATLNLGYDYSTSDGSIQIPVDAAFAYRTAADGTDQSGEARIYTQDKKNQLIDFYLKYVKELPSIKSKLDIMGGYSWQHFWRENYVNSTSVDDRYIIEPEKTTPTESYLVSFFGRLNYTLMDRYLLTLTMRNDGTSRFSEDNRWALFPSMAFAWRINEESFLKDVNAVSNLKLRLGYGITGQQYITTNDYPYLAKYTYSQETARYLFGNEWVNMARPDGYDANLKWEETTTYNVGLDYGFFKDRINGSLELYQRETKDLINQIPVAAGTNFTNILLTNVGNLENKGVEFNMNIRPIVKEGLFWEIGFNISKNTNTITKLTKVNDPNYAGAFDGRISGGNGNYAKINSVNKPANSFYVYQQVYGDDGLPIIGLYVDRNKDGEVNDLDKYHFHSSTPDVIMGFSSRVEYKNWDFSINSRLSLGNYMYNDFESSNSSYQYLYQGNYLTNIPVSIKKSEFETATFLTDFHVQDASFFKIDNISVGYRFDELFTEKLNMKLSFTVQNVLVVTDYDGIDPEVYDGIDRDIYPRPRTFVLGALINF